MSDSLVDTSGPYVYRRIWGSSAFDVYAVGESGLLAHYAGATSACGLNQSVPDHHADATAVRPVPNGETSYPLRLRSGTIKYDTGSAVVALPCSHT